MLDLILVLTFGWMGQSVKKTFIFVGINFTDFFKDMFSRAVKIVDSKIANSTPGTWNVHLLTFKHMIQSAHIIHTQNSTKRINMILQYI
mgnify:CR=1 FL=1